MEHHPTIFQIPNFLGPLGIPGPWVPEHVTMAWLVMAILVSLSYLATRRLESVPGPMQNFTEVVVEAFGDLLEQMIGPKGKRYLPLIGTAGLFILVGNLLGSIPGLKPPTANLNTTAALAITVFLSYNYFGIREQGIVGYLRHFCGPVLWLAPIMFPIEFIGHLARPISLSIRLFGNIFGEESVIAILLSLIWLGIPYVIYLAIMMPLSLFTSFVQTFIFVMLSMVYVAGAVEVEHEEHH
ncbi:MAG TPA: F0F1 ATP synthase subunit A [Candidatus Methylomirabilis sp.]|nr:F0F1 ATP synthase subunit A [Candidatus Methylomirabilis sp.]